MTFQKYLTNTVKIDERYRTHYIRWVTQFIRFACNYGPKISSENVNAFLKTNFSQHQDWQVKQAEDAIRCYRNYLNRNSEKTPIIPKSPGNIESWYKAEGTMKIALRLKHRSYRTEKSYLNWLRRFGKYLSYPQLDGITDDALKKYLSYLAVRCHVAAATQNQAFNALPFFSGTS